MNANRLAACVKPVIEGLERRQLMSVTVSPLFQDSEGHWTLRIRGDSKNDTVTIVDDPGAGLATVTANGFNGGLPLDIAYPDASNPATGDIEVFDIDLKGGKDSISFTNASAYDGQTRAIHLDGDTGDDQINLDLSADLRNGSDITVQIDGDSGNDKVLAGLGDASDSKLDLDVTAGDGNDRVEVYAYDLEIGGRNGPNYNSDVTVAVDLGSGKNVGHFHGYGTRLYADSVLDVDFRGGNSTGSSFDDILIDLGNTGVSGKLFVDVVAGAGDDKVNTRVDGMFVSDSGAEDYYAPTVVINLNGGDGKDTINVTNNYQGYYNYDGLYLGETAFFSLTVRGGNGDDKLTTDFSYATDVEAGSQFVLNVDGQNNSDTINATINFGDLTPVTAPITASLVAQFVGGGGQADISIKGGQQADKVTVNASDDSTNKVIFGPSLYSFLIDGQTDSKDVANVFTVGLSQAPTVRNFETSTVVNI